MRAGKREGSAGGYRSQFRTADTVCFASGTGTQARPCQMVDSRVGTEQQPENASL